MLDKICSFLLLPFYAIWKVLLSNNFERKEFQERMFPGSYFFTLIAYITFYLDVSNLLAKIVFGGFTILTLLSLVSSHIKTLVLKNLEKEYIKNKWLIYKKLILYIVTSLTFSTFFKYPPILFVSFSQMIFLFVIVGFEFPDEPPKKKEEKEESGSWLAKLMPQKPVTNV